MTEEQTETTVSAKQPMTFYWQELWQYRDLFYILSWRDLKVRYKQTALGVAWAVIRPLLTMLIFTFVFGKIAGLEEATTIAYPLLVLTGVLAWQLVSTCISESSNALLANERLLTKVYFPRLIIPLSALATCLVDFLIALSLQLLLFVYYGQWPAVSSLLLPIWVLLTLFFALGIGLGLGALNVRYRDFRYALPFLLQVGMFLSPVGFSSGAVPEKWQLFYQLNPVVGLIESFRWCLLDGSFAGFPISSLLWSVACMVLGLWLGLWYFKQTERTLADII